MKTLGKPRVSLACLMLPFLLAGMVAGTPVQLDPSFNTGTGPSNTVHDMVVEPGGAVWIAGSFTTVNATARNGVAKLTASGVLDPSFVPPTALQGVTEVVPLADGKVLVGGGYLGFFGSASRYGILRLDAAGAYDSTFNASATLSSTVNAVIVLADGKILVGGAFTGGIARLLENGTPDPTFTPGGGTTGTVNSLVVLPDGKILVGGSFSTFGGQPRDNLCRLNQNGNLEPGFGGAGFVSSTINDMAVQADGKILIAGSFSSVGGQSHSYLARMSADGMTDHDFNPSINSTIHSLAALADGRMLIGGSFTTVGSMNRQRIALLHADGTPDATFDSASGASSTVRKFRLQPDGKILIGGDFTTFAGSTARYVARLTAVSVQTKAVASGMSPAIAEAGTVLRLSGSNFSNLTGIDFASGVPALFTVLSETALDVSVPGGAVTGKLTLKSPYGDSYSPRPFYRLPGVPGTLDPTFAVGSGASSAVYALSQATAGQVVVAGNFSTINGASRSCVARLNPDGSVDDGFAPPSSSSSLRSLAVLPDGKILVGGYKIGAVFGIARLNPDGSPDGSFDGQSVGSYVYAIAVQTDGKILVGGSFNRRLARINPNGSPDPTFNVGSGMTSDVKAIKLLPDGRILVGGHFSTYNGATAKYVVRLLSNGVIDPTFQVPGNGVSGSVYALALQGNGSVLIGGTFSSVNSNSSLKYLARLGPDGAPDTSFVPIPNTTVNSLEIMDDGRFAVGGNFTSIGGFARNNAALFHADGSVVTAFNTLGGPSAIVYSVLPDAAGNLFIGGDFSNIGGSPPAYVARLYGDGGETRPAVGSLLPATGFPGGIVTIHGSNLGALTAVEFAGGAAAVIQPVSQTVVQVTVPPGAMSGPITLRNAFGDGISPGIFKLLAAPAPVILGIPAGVVETGTVISVTGANFHDVTTVRIGVLAAQFTVISATEMSVTVPANAVTARVILTGPGGTVQSSSDLSVVKAKPVITSATSAGGVVGQAFSFTLKASNSPTAFSAAPLPAGLALNVSTGVISGIPTASGLTPVAISATNAGGTTLGSLDLTISPPPPPVVSSVTPPYVPSGGKILVSGNYLTQTTGVTVGGVVASFAILSDGSIAVTLPAGVVSGVVEVTTLQGVVTSTTSVTQWDFLGGSQEITAFGSNVIGEGSPPAGDLNYIALAAGDYHNLAIRADGTVTGWGGNWVGQATPPATLAPATAVAAGAFHSLALQADGTVAGWGRDDEGQCSGAAGLQGVAAISAGSYHSLALLRNGTVRAWGLDSSGQTDVPESLGGVVAIAAGGDVSLALKSDGTVVAWGYPSDGQTQVPASATDIVAISAGLSHVVALKADGTVICWGANWGGQCTPPPGLTGVVEISVGTNHTIARRQDGTCAAWGATSAGQSTVPAGVTNAIGVAAGGDHTLILRAVSPSPKITVPRLVTGTPGTPFAFAPVSLNGPFQFSAENLPAGFSIDPATGTISGTPTPGGERVVTLVARNAYGISRTHFRLFLGPYIIGWGSGLPGPIPQNLNNVVKVAAGPTHCLALLNDGTVTAWGSNSNGERTIPSGLTNVVSIAAGDHFSLALKSDGTVIGWGYNAFGPWPNPLATGVVEIDALGRLATALTSDGKAKNIAGNYIGAVTGSELISAVTQSDGYSGFGASGVAGINRAGYLSTYPYSSTPTSPPPSGFDRVAQSGSGQYSSSFDSMPQWGVRQNGELYEFQTERYSSALNIILRPETSSASQLAGGYQFVLVLNDDGSATTLAATPDPDYYSNVPSPPRPTSEVLVNVTAIAASDQYCLAIKEPSARVRFTSPRVLQGRVGQSFNHQLAAGSGVTSYTTALLPSGIGLNPASGKISGTPSTPGVFNFLVTARRSTYFTTQVISLKVTGGVAPVDLTLSGNTVAEDLPTGTPVGTLSTVDFSPADTFTYSLVSGPGALDNSKFKITGNQLVTNSVLDFEKLTQASIRIRVTDSGYNSFEKLFTIHITDVTTDDDDKDGLTQAEEALLGTNPLVADSDGDGAGDGQEVTAGTGPLNAASKPASYVACWGSNTSGQCNVPVDLGPVIAVAAGSSHTLALRADGTVAAWGSNSSGESIVPVGLSNVVSIAAGYSSSFALKSDGSVVAWGSSTYDLNVVPPGLGNVIEISAREFNVAALKADGTVVVWGSNYNGALAVPEAAQGSSLHISVGASNVLALNRNGNTIGWGSDSSKESSGPATRTDTVSLAAGGNLSLALDSDGKISAWGSSAYSATTPPAGIGPVIDISAGRYLGLAIEEGGHLSVWGYTYSGHTNVPPALGAVRKVSTSSSHVAALVGPSDRFLTSSINAVVGLPMVHQVAFTGNADQFSAGFLPPGISFDTATATFSGTLTASGTYNVRVTAESGFTRTTRIIPIRCELPRNFEEWAGGQFPAFDPLGGLLADPDNDLVVNLMEYVLHRNPLGQDPSPPTQLSVTQAGGQNHLSLTYERLTSATDIQCVVEVSGNLADWLSGPGATTTVSIVPHAETETVTVRDNAPLGSAPRFIRLRVVK